MAPTFVSVAIPFVALLLTSAIVRAEQHTVRFENKCGHGTPQLIRGATVLSSGEDYVSNGPLSSTIAYLQTGDCDFNGEHCTLVETTLNNPDCPGCGSSTDISLIAPHAFSVETGFSYFGGCDGTGATCSTPDCKTAFFQPDDTHVQVACQSNNVNLLITFCGSSGGSAAAASPAPSPSSSKAQVPAASPSPSPSSVPINAAPSPPTEASPSSSPEASPTSSPTEQPSAASTCRKSHKKRSNLKARAIPEDIMIRASDPRAREMYDAHRRRHHAKMYGRYPNA